MKRITYVLRRAAFAILVSLVGCGTTPTPTPTPVPDVTDYSMVCQHLADLGCPEGLAPECAAAFGRACGSVLCE